MCCRSNRNTIPRCDLSTRPSGARMNSRSYFNLRPHPQASNARRSRLLAAAVFLLLWLCWGASATANDAPAWMHALVGVPLPDHDEKANAVLLYSEQVVTLQSAEKMKI